MSGIFGMGVMVGSRDVEESLADFEETLVLWGPGRKRVKPRKLVRGRETDFLDSLMLWRIAGS